jgi:hypothetical protein
MTFNFILKLCMAQFGHFVPTFSSVEHGTSFEHSKKSQLEIGPRAFCSSSAVASRLGTEAAAKQGKQESKHQHVALRAEDLH